MCWILIHVDRKAENCTSGTAGFPVGNSVLTSPSLKDCSDQALPLNLEMMSKSQNSWG